MRGNYAMRFRMFGTWLLVSLIAMSAMGVSAQLGMAGIYTSSVTGNTIEWESGWMLGTQDVNDILSYDRTTLFNPVDTTIVDIFFTSQQIDAETMRDGMLDAFMTEDESFQIVDSGEYGDIAYLLSIITGTEDVFGSFILADTSGSSGSGIHLIGPITSFEASVITAQSGLKIDFAPVLRGIDGARLQKQLEAAPRVEPAGTPVASDEMNTDQVTTFTSDEWGYTVAYPGDWTESGYIDVELEVFNSTNTATVNFMGMENTGLHPEDLESELETTFMETVHPFGTMVSVSSDENSAIIVVEMDNMILVQQLIVVSPEVIVIVTVFVSGDLDSLLPELNVITVDENPVLDAL